MSLGLDIRDMKFKRTDLALMTAFSFFILPGCSGLFNLPERKTPEDIYLYESQNYPHFGWTYLGSTHRWHYFFPIKQRLFETHPDWKISKDLLPDLQGHPYSISRNKQKGKSADIEILQDYIWIHVDDEKSVKIPFKSKGFVSEERRLEVEKRRRAYMDHLLETRFGADAMNKARQEQPKAVRAVISKDGSILFEKGNSKTEP